MKTNRIILALIAGFQAFSFADHVQQGSFGYSLSKEWSDIGQISSLDFNLRLNDSSKVGFELGTGLAFASITERDGFVEDYLAWQGSVKFGYYSDVSVYGELGLDLGEALLTSWIPDDCNDSDRYTDDDHCNDVDGFIGFGAGFHHEHLDVNFFARYRWMNGLFLEDTSDIFTGVELSIRF